MLSIIFGNEYDENEEMIYDTNMYFDNTYEDEWITDDLSRRIIKDVDKSEVIGPNLIQSPILGPIPPSTLSGGTKTLILINNDQNHIFNASTCGDNCAKWILNIAEKKDITINLRHPMDFGDKELNIKIINSGVTVHNMKEYLHESIKYT